MKTKIINIVKSKTVWLAILTGITGVLMAIPQDMLTQQEAGVITTILGLLTFANRFLTKTSL